MLIVNSVYIYINLYISFVFRNIIVYNEKKGNNNYMIFNNHFLFQKIK